jgi:hypothetical protein
VEEGEGDVVEERERRGRRVVEEEENRGSRSGKETYYIRLAFVRVASDMVKSLKSRLMFVSETAEFVIVT